MKFAFRLARHCALVFATCTVVLTVHCAVAQVTPRDCVEVRYVQDGNVRGLNRPVAVSPSGDQLAYLIKAPDLNTNENLFELHIRPASDSAPDLDRIVVTGESISNIQWLGDNRRIALLISKSRKTSIQIIDTVNGDIELAAAGTEIREYAISSNGDRVAYSAGDGDSFAVDQLPDPGKDAAADGYHVPYLKTLGTELPSRSLFVTDRSGPHAWSRPSLVVVHDVFTHEPLQRVPVLRWVTMAPDGSRILFSYGVGTVPEEWKTHPSVSYIVNGGGIVETPAMYEVATEETTLAMKVPEFGGLPTWSRDSRSYIVASPSPLGSQWEESDIKDHRSTPGKANLFWVDVQDHKVEQIVSNVPRWIEPPVGWLPGGDVLIHTDTGIVSRFHREGGSWRNVERTPIPEGNGSTLYFMASNATTIFGEFQTRTVPPDIFALSLRTHSLRLLTDLNSRIRKVALSEPEIVHWQTDDGMTVDGVLFKPSGYESGRQYPLLIQTKVMHDGFVCDAGGDHFPSFIPQPAASAGMLYLARTLPATYKAQDEQAHYSKAYPGRIGEVMHDMDVWQSGIKMLETRGIVDRNKVGIIGFSRTGWEVQFYLAHSSVHFAAATAADSSLYSMGGYWMDASQFSRTDNEAMYGGPPYEKTLKNWLEYSVSFNLDKIQTPLLIEQMGYGTSERSAATIPLFLTEVREVYMGLSRLGRPVDLYYYPNEPHQPEHPRARLASLQRNLDWYQFWLQDHERLNPEDPDQYPRWRQMRLKLAPVPRADNLKAISVTDTTTR